MNRFPENPKKKERVKQKKPAKPPPAVLRTLKLSTLSFSTPYLTAKYLAKKNSDLPDHMQKKKKRKERRWERARTKGNRRRARFGSGVGAAPRPAFLHTSVHPPSEEEASFSEYATLTVLTPSWGVLRHWQSRCCSCICHASVRGTAPRPPSSRRRLAVRIQYTSDHTTAGRRRHSGALQPCCISVHVPMLKCELGTCIPYLTREPHATKQSTRKLPYPSTKYS
jgi:hypothetical protein